MHFKISVKSKAFTIIELLVSIAIIGLLIALLIPNIDRSLNKNQIVNDVDLFKAKLEETRLLSGSTQQDDNTTTSDVVDVGYYAIIIPTGGSDYFDIVRISYSPNLDQGLCTPSIAISQSNGLVGVCTVERVKLSKNITLANSVEQIIAFRVPTQRFLTITQAGNDWVESVPEFNNPFFSFVYLSTAQLTANIKIDNYTGRVTASYVKN